MQKKTILAPWHHQREQTSVALSGLADLAHSDPGVYGTPLRFVLHPWLTSDAPSALRYCYSGNIATKPSAMPLACVIERRRCLKVKLLQYPILAILLLTLTVLLSFS